MPRLAALLLAAAALAGCASSARAPGAPPGFTPLFDSRTLDGWHVSRTTHHGTTPDVRVEDGAIVLRQHPYGQGGLLMTDGVYGDFELTLEVLPEPGTNGGLLFRATEGGSGYQVEIVGGGAPGTGSLFGEMLRVEGAVRAEGVQDVWRAGDWNRLRLRVEGAAPHATLWINDVLIWDVQLPRNDLTAGRTAGRIALQAHWSATELPVADAFPMHASWRPGAAHRYRNLAIRPLD